MHKLVFFCFGLLNLLQTPVWSQPAVRFCRESAKGAVAPVADRRSVRTCFPTTFSDGDSILWIGEMPVPPFCNGASGRIDLSPASRVQDECFFSFSSTWHSIKALVLPNKFFNKADKDPLQWSPAPAKNIFLFCEKANPSNRFSVSVQNGAQGPFQPEPFVFFGDSGNTCVLLFGLDSLYAYQPENDLRHSIPLPAFRQKNHSSLLLSTHFDAGKPRLTSKEIFPSGDWSLFLEDGDKLRATLFTTLSEGLKTRTENKDKRAFVSLVLEDAEVIRFEDPGVMEVFLDGVISIFSKPVQSDADRKEAFWKLTSETGKTGFKSMLRNPVCLSGLMWGRPGGTGREKLILTVFETMAGKSQTWVLDVFSSSPAWSALSEENHSALWKTAGRGRDLNVIWRDFFGSSPDDKIYLGLFPDLLDH